MERLKNKNTKIDNLILEQFLRRIFFISENIGCEKPYPKAFLNVTSRLNVNPEECLFIGDSYRNDIMGVKC